MQNKQISSRRQFLKTTATGAAVLAATGPFHKAYGQVNGANERIGIGFIGCGGRSHAHMSMTRHMRDKLKMNIDLVAACDVYKPRMEGRRKEFGIAKGYMDYKELLADKDVDLVCIATPDFWHGYHAIAAIKAGKDVYCEKPVTHWSQFELTRELADVVAKSDRVLQVGTQAMSDGVWHQMKKLVQEDGLIGQPLFGETSFFRIGDWGERGMPIDDPGAKPGANLNWEGWLGDRPKVKHNVDRQFRWRLYDEYAGGPVTDLFPHCMTQLVDILGVGFPDTVVATGGIHRFEHELRTVPDSFNLIAEYPEKVTISVLSTQANDYNSVEGGRGSGHRQPIIRGWDGSLTIWKNKEILFTPLKVRGAKKSKRIKIERSEDNVKHWQNLIACCRDRKQTPWSPMDLAFRTQTVCQMGMLGWKQGKVAKFDAKNRKIIL